MGVLYISEADAVRDIASLLEKVRAGAEIVIENGTSTVAVLMPPPAEDGLEEPEPGHDEWFRAEVERTMHSDPSRRLSEEQVEAFFAEKRSETLRMMRDNVA